MDDKPYYVSQEGLVNLKEKLEVLKTKERKNIAERIKEAVEAGDISDSPAYESAREAQSINEGRILELEDLIKRAAIIKKRQNSTTVAIGSGVEVKSGLKKMEFTIVGSEESDPAKGFISNESPLGQALLARRMDKPRLIAETGAGQHGVATATVAALFGLECEVFMGDEDIKRQAINVFKMKLLGTKVTPVHSY